MLAQVGFHFERIPPGRKECEPHDEERDDTTDRSAGSDVATVKTAVPAAATVASQVSRRPATARAAVQAEAEAEADADMFAREALRMAIEARQAVERLRRYRSGLPAHRASTPGQQAHGP